MLSVRHNAIINDFLIYWGVAGRVKIFFGFFPLLYLVTYFLYIVPYVLYLSSSLQSRSI